MILPIAILSLWVSWLLFIRLGNIRLKRRWKKRLEFQPPPPTPTVSWLLPFRNEENNIRRYLAELSPQRLSLFLWIDDNSSDSGPLELKQHRAALIQNENQGKKAALVTGWKQHPSEWSLHTDADVEWTEESMAAWERALSQVSEQTVLVAGLPSLEGHAWDAEDFQANMFVAAGMAGWGLPFLCSGAALALRSKRLSDPLRPWLGPGMSGDDVFLLHQVLAHFGPGAVETLPCPKLKVRGAESLKKAVKQRIRWAGKSIWFRNPVAISVSVFIYGLHAVGLIFLLWPGPLWQKLGLIGTKAMADLLLSTGKGSRIGARLVLSLVYWIYIPLLPTLAWLSMPWREAKKVW
jgi:glycosyltransferase involved in cell wall biosynthesis